MKTGFFSHVQFAVRSELGLKRPNNEDSHGEFPELGVWCVADGMGGGDDGEVASAAVVQQVGDFCRAHASVAYAGPDVARGLIQAVNLASRWICRRSLEKNLKGCGSTFVGVAFDPADPANALALHAGDSRLYRIRGRDIRQITRDHSAAELIGAKNETDVNPMFRGMILRAVGVHPGVDVETTKFQVREGDVVLLCSDGLSKMVADKAIASIVRKQTASVQAVADALVDAAYAQGATDNVTVTVLKIGALPKPVPVCPLDFAEPAAASVGEENGDTATGETSLGVGPDDWTSATVATHGGADVATAVDAEVFPVAEDEAETGVKTWRERIRGGYGMALAGVGIFGLLTLVAVLLWWLGGAEVRRLKVERAVEPTSVPVLCSSAKEERVETPPPSVAPSADASSERKPSSMGGSSVAAASKAVSPPKGKSPSADELARSALLAQLKARREKARGDEKKEVAAEAAFVRSIAALIEVSRGRRFQGFVARIEVVSGHSAAERVRLVGSRLAGMKGSDDKAGSAACDLVMEIQRAVRNAQAASAALAPAKNLAGIVECDPATHEAFDACAGLISTVGNGGN